MTPRGVPPGEPPDEPDLDAQWQDIVARLGDLEPGPDGPTGTEGSREREAPEGPRRPDGPRRRRDDLPGRRTVRPARPDPAEPPGQGPADDEADRTDPADDAGDPRAWAPDPAVEEAEDHFVPPDPGPVLGGDPVLVMAWVAVLAAPLLVLVAVIAWPAMPTWLLEVGGVGFLAGVGLLLWRMPHRRDPDDEDDNGAVV
jgi:hypothetical protein